jgi:CheY-like chemotaxis protein
MVKDLPAVMIVDDDVDVAASLSEVLTGTGRYNVITTHSAYEALDIIKNNKGFLGLARNKVRLILLDIRMPGMTGIEFLKKLKEEIDGRVDVVIVTAFDDDENWADTFFTYEVVSFLTKPVDKKGLISLVDSYFRGEKHNLRKATARNFGTRRIVGEIERSKNEIEKTREQIRKIREAQQ